MIVGVPKEIKRDEYRVALLPVGVEELPGLVADEANWLIDPVNLPSQVEVQIRYNGQPKPATLTVDAAAPERFGIQFRQPQLAVAPGQAAVVFQGSRVLGGGWIC